MLLYVQLGVNYSSVQLTTVSIGASVSVTISNALENHQPWKKKNSIVNNAPFIQSSNRMAPNVSMLNAAL